MSRTLKELLAQGAECRCRHVGARPAGADPRRAAPLIDTTLAQPQRPGPRPQRPRRHRARQRPRDGHLLHRLRQRRDQRAAEPGLPRRRVRVLPVRPERQGADRRARQHLAGGRRWRSKLGVRVIDLVGRTPRSRPAASRCEPRDGAGGRAGRERRLCPAGRRRRWCCTPRAPPRGRRSCRCRRRNLCASAAHIARTLQFTPADCGLNIMPLFHIHGLIAGVLAPLSAGSQVFCTPGFNALKFFGWMDEAKPTWYTAVPTMHQAILGRASQERRRDRAPPAALPALVVVVDAAAGDPRARGGLRRAADRGLRHDRGHAPDGLATRCRRRCASPARWAWPPAPRWRSWARTARCCRAARPARS